MKTSEILTGLELNRNTFQDWLDRKLIVPSVQQSTKQGEPNVFSKNDVYCIQLFKRLIEQGFTRGLAKLVIENLNFDNVGSKRDQSKYAVLKRGWVSKLESGISFSLSLTKKPPEVDFKKAETFSLIFNLLAIKDDVDKRLEDFQK
jgi:hypothetical protein